ncbi:MAG: Ni/Fe-hydrogenase cytochrome b subunit [Chloroflexi bacterium]|nr:Ni/Fe-hydrogenase cytochrome b subunit [Chloroflexota bacterium]
MTTPQKERRLPVGTLFLALLVVIFLATAVVRYAKGLGFISNMSDGRGWGIWIGFDLYCGVALAAGGFTLAAIVYIFHLEKYHPVVRPAILTAFLGYLLVVFALLVDLGQPWYIWKMIFNPNIHSPLYEVGWCVMLYTAVLALEISPAVFEKLNWSIPLKFIRMIQIPLIIAGIVISTGHQNSLGSMSLLFSNTLNHLWYTPILPLLFFVSAVAVGPAMVILESTLSGKAFGHQVKLEVLSGLGKIVSYILGVYLALKVGDIVFAGWPHFNELKALGNEYPANVFWFAEVILGVILPMVLFSMPKVRQSRTGLFCSALLVIGGLVFNRFNITLIQLPPRPGYTYFPSWQEFAVSIGLVSGGIIVFMLANRFLPIAEHHEESVEHKPDKAATTEAGSIVGPIDK